MRERELRRRCRQLLKELGVRPPLDVHQLCRKVGEQRGRPIRLLAHPIPVPGPFGVWIRTAQTDYILFQEGTSRAHQDHIVLHELGHIIAGHQRDDADDSLLTHLRTGDEPWSTRFPDLDPESVRRALHRTSYDTEREREAETVATIILEWAAVLDGVVGTSSVEPVAQRMESALGDRLGWL